ncbi:hypothetical protein GQR58_017877 [Nymphon striatum]|nr:hypothetical protein GQR58_017877 [Nymphon striatum]
MSTITSRKRPQFYSKVLHLYLSQEQELRKLDVVVKIPPLPPWQEMKLKAAEEEEKLRKRLEKKSEKERRKQEHMSRKLEQSENLSSNHSKENAETIDKTWKGILSRSLVYFIYIYNEG